LLTNHHPNVPFHKLKMNGIFIPFANTSKSLCVTDKLIFTLSSIINEERNISVI